MYMRRHLLQFCLQPSWAPWWSVVSRGSSSFTVLNCTSTEISVKTGQKDPFSLPQRKPCGHICLVFPNFFKIMSCVQKIACALMVLLTTHEKLVPATLNLYRNNLLQNKIFAICAFIPHKIINDKFLLLLISFVSLLWYCDEIWFFIWPFSWS